jgi:general stress protein YciG
MALKGFRPVRCALLECGGRLIGWNAASACDPGLWHGDCEQRSAAAAAFQPMRERRLTMPNQKGSRNQSSKGGFASMDKEKQRDAARKGGEASQGSGGTIQRAGNR